MKPAWYEMKPKDRIYAAIRHEKTDRTPRGEILIDDDVVQSFLCCNEVTFVERREFVRSLGLDLICQRVVFSPQPAGVTLPEAAGVTWGDLNDWAGRTDYFTFLILDGAFGWGMRLLGLKRFMMAMMRESSDVIDLIKAVEALNLELARRGRDCGAMGVLLADDLAYQRGLMVSPELLRRYFLPSLARQAKDMTDLGLKVFFHSDGNLNEIFADLADVNFAGWQGLEAAAGIDLALVKERYGAHPCLWGNLDPGFLTLPRGVEEIAKQVGSILKAADQSGGFIFGDQ